VGTLVLLCCSLGSGVAAEDRSWALLEDLPRLTGPLPSRVSSNDPSGGNADFRPIPAGGTITILDQQGAGCIRRLWCTIAAKEEHHLRKIVLRMFWDGEQSPSVEVPLGDFFGLGHGDYFHYVSLPMSAAVGKGLTCFFPMPFSRSARIEVENQGSEEVRKFYWNIDLDSGLQTEDAGRFHAQWGRENPTTAAAGSGASENYVILDAKGKGRYLGCVLSVHSLQPQWWGEGDEAIEIDGSRTLLGTGVEDYCCCAWEFTQPFWGPTFGAPYVRPAKEPEKVTAYRWHLEDPQRFTQSIRVSMGHGSQNDRADDWSSVAYWYQTEPHAAFSLAPVGDRIPRPFARSEGVEAESSVRVPGAPVVAQPTRRIIAPAPTEEELAGPSPYVAALAVVLLAVWLPAAVVGALWYVRRRKP
jgi:hypothetical protein